MFVTVQMEIIDEELKINIRSILPSISEETVNGIIHAVKYAGLETMSDLQLVQEEDLILVLRPIQRRKLVKAWSEQIILPVNVASTLSMPKVKWNKKRSLKLLQLYTNYKAEFLHPQIDEQTVWKKIAGEVKKLYRTLNCDEFDCRNKIGELKCEYERIKDEHAKDQETANFLDEARRAFETTENPVILPVNVSSTLSIPKFKWNKKRCLKLLQLYTSYKTEFLHPHIDEQTVWKKIAREVQKYYQTLSCDELDCCNTIGELKCEYERIKNKHAKDQDTANFLDEAKRAFETTENPVSLSTEQSTNTPLLNCRKRKRTVEFHSKLLELYVKYKTEPASLDNKNQNMWKKIAQEMRERYSFDCSESLCRFELFQLKCQYENFWKKRNVKSGNLSYFFDEAREAFGIPENLVNSNSQVDEIKKKVGIYIPPHLRNGVNKQSESMPPSKIENRDFTIKVSNISENVTESSLENLFRPFGTITRFTTLKDSSGFCDCAFVSFEKQEDAIRAYLAVHGINYNWKKSALKVEWAEPSEII